MRLLYLFLFILTLLSCNNNNAVKSPSAQVAEHDVVPELKTALADTSGGLYREYYPSGKKKLEGKLVSGKREGEWLFWYENGVVWSIGEFQEGKRSGKSVVYYDNGVLRMEGQYVNNRARGPWKFYSREGKLIKEANLK